MTIREPASPSLRQRNPKEGESSLLRMLGVVELFTAERPSWTVEQIAEAMSLTQSTAYRYVAALSSYGYLAPMSRAEYALGPKIISLDLVIRQTDPLISEAKRKAGELLALVPEGVVSLINLHGDTAVSVFQIRKPEELTISFERGRSMPLYTGSAAKVILAHLPRSRLLKLYANSHTAIQSAGLGATWKEFSRALLHLRRQPAISTVGELNPDSWGIAAPVFTADGDIKGSLNLIMPRTSHADADLAGLTAHVAEAAQRLSQSWPTHSPAETGDKVTLGDPA